MNGSGPGGWRYFGVERPPFAEEPGPGQESVWDYPRPPRLAPDARSVEVRRPTGTSDGSDEVLAASTGTVRVLETASPPTFYLPPDDVRVGALTRSAGSSYCEWKGRATYWAITLAGGQTVDVGWSYEDPTPDFASLRGWFSFYPGRVACFVDGERVRPQAGGFYGGWVTDEIVGPMKGDPGTGSW